MSSGSSKFRRVAGGAKAVVAGGAKAGAGAAESSAPSAAGSAGAGDDLGFDLSVAVYPSSMRSPTGRVQASLRSSLRVSALSFGGIMSSAAAEDEFNELAAAIDQRFPVGTFSIAVASGPGAGSEAPSASNWRVWRDAAAALELTGWAPEGDVSKPLFSAFSIGADGDEPSSDDGDCDAGSVSVGSGSSSEDGAFVHDKSRDTGPLGVSDGHLAALHAARLRALGDGGACVCGRCGASTSTFVVCTSCLVMCSLCDSAWHADRFPHARTLRTSDPQLIAAVVPSASLRGPVLELELSANEFVGQGTLTCRRLWLPHMRRCACGSATHAPYGTGARIESLFIPALRESVWVYGLAGATECMRPPALKCQQCGTVAKFVPALELPRRLFPGSEKRVNTVFEYSLLDMLVAIGHAKPSWGVWTSIRFLAYLRDSSSPLRSAATASMASALGFLDEGDASVAAAALLLVGEAAAVVGGGAAPLGSAPRLRVSPETALMRWPLPTRPALAHGLRAFRLLQFMANVESAVQPRDCPTCALHLTRAACDACVKLNEAKLRQAVAWVSAAESTFSGVLWEPRKTVAAFTASLAPAARGARGSAPCADGPQHVTSAAAKGGDASLESHASAGVWNAACPHEWPLSRFIDFYGGEQYAHVVYLLQRLAERYSMQDASIAQLATVVSTADKAAAEAWLAAAPPLPSGARAGEGVLGTGASPERAATSPGAGTGAGAGAGPGAGDASASAAPPVFAWATVTGGVPLTGAVPGPLLSFAFPGTPWGYTSRLPLPSDIFARVPLVQPPAGLVVGLDFMCLLLPYLRRHALLSSLPVFTFLVPFFHAMSHRWACVPALSFVLQIGLGWAVLEDCERMWARYYQLLHTSRQQAPATRGCDLALFVAEDGAHRQWDHAARLVREVITAERRALQKLHDFLALIDKQCATRHVSPTVLYASVDRSIASLLGRASAALAGGTVLQAGVPSEDACELLLQGLGAAKVELAALEAQAALAVAASCSSSMDPAFRAALDDFLTTTLPGPLLSGAARTDRVAALRADVHRLSSRVAASGRIDRTSDAPGAYLSKLEADLLLKIMARLYTLMGHLEQHDAATAAKGRAAVKHRSAQVKVELKRLWDRVTTIHRFCLPPVSAIVLPVIKFDAPPATLILILTTAFGASSHAAAAFVTGYSDCLAMAASLLQQAWLERSRTRYAIVVAKEYWRQKVQQTAVAARELLQPSAAAAAPAPSPPSRVSDYVPSPALLHDPASRRALALRMLEGHARACMMLEDTSRALAYVTSPAFTAEALATRRGNQATLASWAEAVMDGKGPAVDARPFGRGGGKTPRAS